MPTSTFDDHDMGQLESRGISVEEIQRQLFRFQKGSGYCDLVRACTVGDGIEQLDGQDLEKLPALSDRAAADGRISRFVPASGAATRMFRDLFHFFLMGPSERPAYEELRADAGRSAGHAAELVTFLDGIDRFAFEPQLREILSARGLELDNIRASGGYSAILDALLSSDGLGYADMPKGLVLFHRYEDGNRTSLEEHLVETEAYARDADSVCRLHLTVSPEHLKTFAVALKETGSRMAERLGVKFRVDFSVQKSSTDTLAVDLDNRPFRTERGRLLFRPGGHGALLDNLDELDADIVFIKNIDNVQPDRVKKTVNMWKRALGGFLVILQERIFDYLDRLEKGSDDEDLVEEVLRFTRDSLHIHPPERRSPLSVAELRDYLIERLDRPVRICGVVENTGEPGGGPFWVRDRRGEISLQIVESAQVDPDSDEHRQIFSSSTHFNPVDLVCGVRDRHGKPFDLKKYVDPDAVIVTRKSSGGRDLKALERPGLWNGGMSGWTTVFVEVPLETFSPVKTVNDLLRPEHQ